MTYQHPLRSISRRVLALAAALLVAIAMTAAMLPAAHASTISSTQSTLAGAPMSGGDDGNCFLFWDPTWGYYIACFGDD